ncbi:conserved hypothetical protein [Burkholderia pseudomallei 576]|nr:conserved hypothetical protein [Burkholderia pseudomallei 576]
MRVRGGLRFAIGATHDGARHAARRAANDGAHAFGNAPIARCVAREIEVAPDGALPRGVAAS